jgi:hypothetical protein
MQGVRMGEESKVKQQIGGKATGKVASGIETGSFFVAKGFVKGGRAIAKGAKGLVILSFSFSFLSFYYYYYSFQIIFI